ncbi:MAG: PKD domain-containing protein, partial [Promethearchaeia archaeon]
MNYTSQYIPRLKENANTTTAEITHVYRREGIYQVTLMVLSRRGTEKSAMKSTSIEIKNTPPKFNISLTNNIIADNATYNFEQDVPAPDLQIHHEDLYDPAGWKEESYWGDMRTKLIDDEVHNKVLELADYTNRGEGAASNFFSDQEEGIVEFWFRRSFGSEDYKPDSYNTGLQISLMNSSISYNGKPYGHTKGLEVRIDNERTDTQNNKITYNNGSSYLDTNFEIYDDYEWLHLKIQFNCKKNQFDLFLNGFLIKENIPFMNEMSTFSALKFSTSHEGVGGYFIDGVGYSWDPNYREGDNFAFKKRNKYSFQEDEYVYLFITDLKDFYPQTIHREMKILWDMGDGFEKQGSLGVAYKWTESAVYNVSASLIDNLNALNSEFIKIEIENQKPQADFKYTIDTPATHSFNHDAVGNPPTGWMIHDGERYIPQEWYTEKNYSRNIICEQPKVTDWYEGRYKPVKFSDRSDLDFSAMQFQLTQTMFNRSKIKRGTFEFWYYSENINKTFKIYGYSTPTSERDPFWKDYEYKWHHNYDRPEVSGKIPRGMTIRIKNGRVQWREPMPSYRPRFYNFSNLNKLESHKWYHIKVDFNHDDEVNYKGLSRDQFRVYINNHPSEVVSFSDNFISMKYLGFMTGLQASQFTCYIDSLGFSWDKDYEIGENFRHFRESFAATHDFRYKPDGPFPDQSSDITWFNENDEDCFTQKISEEGNHFDVLKLEDRSSYGKAKLSNNLEIIPKKGTLEFWIKSTDVYKTTEFELDLSEHWKKIKLRIFNGEMQYYTSPGEWKSIPKLPSVTSEKWHHIRITFETRAGDNFGGLSEDEFQVKVDNFSTSPKLSMQNSISGRNQFTVKSTTGDAHYSIYLDAIGYSWDKSYQTGTNLKAKKGFFDKSNIVFTVSGTPDTKSDLKSLRYYWLFGDNTTGFGKGTIHEYENSGKYNVTLLIKDDNGALGQITKQVIIDNRAPETFVLPPFHKATYNFQQDEIGEMPQDWKRGVMTSWVNPNSSIVVKEALDGHRNVLSFEPTTRTPALSYGELPVIGDFDNYLDLFRVDNISNFFGNQSLEGYTPNPIAQENGTLEFYFYTEDLQNPFSMWLAQTIFFLVFIIIPDGMFLTTVNGSWYYTTLGNDIVENAKKMFSGEAKKRIEGIPLMEEDTWNHIRIDWCSDDSNYMQLGEDEFRMVVNGFSSEHYPMNDINYTALFNSFNSSSSMNGTLSNPCVELFPEELKAINLLNFIGNFNDFESRMYMDAFGFSWDKNYSVGDNYLNPSIINEGETYLYETSTAESEGDYMKLDYYWGSAEDLGTEEFEEGGEKWTYLWYDDEHAAHNIVRV